MNLGFISTKPKVNVKRQPKTFLWVFNLGPTWRQLPHPGVILVACTLRNGSATVLLCGPSSANPDRLHLECSTVQYCRTASVARPRISGDDHRITRYRTSLYKHNNKQMKRFVFQTKGLEDGLVFVSFFKMFVLASTLWCFIMEN